MGGSESSPGSGGSVDDVLAHFGVKGMRWGVRKNNSSKGPSDVEVKIRPGRKVVTKGGSGHPPSEDAKRVAISRQKARKSSTDALSTKELQDLVTRMNLESQYAKYAPNSSAAVKGKKFFKSTMSTGKSVNEVIAFTNSPAGKFIAKQVKNAVMKQAAKQAGFKQLAIGG